MTNSLDFDEIYEQIADAFVGDTKAHSDRESGLVRINQVFDDALKKAETKRSSEQTSISELLSKIQQSRRVGDNHLHVLGITLNEFSDAHQPSTVVNSGSYEEFNRAVHRVNEAEQALLQAERNLEDVRRHIAEGMKRLRRALLLCPLVAIIIITAIFVIRGLTPFNLIRSYIMDDNRGNYGIDGVAFSPDGKYVVAITSDDITRIWATDTGNWLRTLFDENMTYSGDSISRLAFSPDGKYILSGSAVFAARLWDAETGSLLHTFGHNDRLPNTALNVTSVAFSPDGRYVLTGSYDHEARLWEIETGNVTRTFTDPAGGIYSVAFSPDGKYIITGDDNVVQLWETETGNLLRTFSGYQDHVWSAAFSPDGKYIITGSADLTTAKLWETETGTLLRTFAHSDEIFSVAFSPDGRYVLTGSSDHTAKLWDANTGDLLRTFTHLQPVISVAFSPDGKYVLTGSVDSTVRLWDSGIK